MLKLPDWEGRFELCSESLPVQSFDEWNSGTLGFHLCFQTGDDYEEVGHLTRILVHGLVMQYVIRCKGVY